jgi:hypothetical protein
VRFVPWRSTSTSRVAATRIVVGGAAVVGLGTPNSLRIVSRLEKAARVIGWETTLPGSMLTGQPFCPYRPLLVLTRNVSLRIREFALP